MGDESRVVTGDVIIKHVGAVSFSWQRVADAAEAHRVDPNSATFRSLWAALDAHQAELVALSNAFGFVTREDGYDVQ